MKILALLLALCAPVLAAPPEALSAWEEMSQVKQLEARFTINRTTKLMIKPLSSEGILRFSRPDSLAWIVEKPGRSTMVMRGNDVGMFYPDLGIREEINLGSQPEIARLVQGMMIWMTADLQRVEADYEIEWVPGTPAKAILRPKNDTIKTILERLELEISGSPNQVTQILFVEPDLDQVMIKLSDINSNPDFAPDAFQLPMSE